MTYIKAFMGVSLDGFISPDAKEAAKFSSPADIKRIREELNEFDTVLMGSSTLRSYGSTLTPLSGKPIRHLIYSHSGEINLADFPVFVKQNKFLKPILITNSLNLGQYHEDDWGRVIQIDSFSDLKELFEYIPGVACLGGARLLTSLISHKLVNELNISFAPVIFGGGVPLISQKISAGLTLDKTTVNTETGEIVANYKVTY